MAVETEEQNDNLDLYRRRIEILSGAKLREKGRINSAVRTQDSIRAKIGKWNGAKEIGKWRRER